MPWHCKAIHGNSKEWRGTARQCVTIQRNSLALKGSVCQFKGIAWQSKAVCSNSKEWPATVMQCVAIQSNGLELQPEVPDKSSFQIKKYPSSTHSFLYEYDRAYNHINNQNSQHVYLKLVTAIQLLLLLQAITSGTSVSAPQMAGIASLILSMQGKGINPHEIDSRIASSSTPLSNHTGNSILDSVCHQGGSLINAWCAAMATTAVSTHLFSQNDTLHFNGTQPLSIINKGKHAVSCTVDHVTAGTTLALEKHNVPNHWSVRPIPGTAVLSFSLNFSAQMHHSMLINLAYSYQENSTLPTQSIGIRCLQSERSKASFCSHSLRPTRIWLPGYAIDPTSVFAPVQCLTNQSLKKLTALLHAIAMNDLGGKSNTGEGGEDASCSLVMPDGDTMRSAIKQVASGQFKVTSKYLANSDELFLNFNIVQIKMAQGAKLPGHKVTKSIAKTRHSTAGVGLISPPPHHNIYSIEDLKTVDLRLQVFQSKGAGLAEADHILISVCQSPLRTRPGGGPSNIRTARDLAIAALLSAEKFGFATTPLIAIGCIMMRYFHQLVSPILFSSPQSLNHCFLPKHLPCRCCSPRPSLKSKFTGQPEHIIKFFYHVAEELRTHMAKMGFRTMNEMVGRTDLLKVDRTLRNPKTVNIDLSVVLKPAWKMRPVFATFKAKQQNHQMYARLDDKFIDEAEPAKGLPVRIEADGKNIELSVMDGLLHLLTRSRYSLVASDEKELEQDTIHVDMRGSAGQSLGALLASAITLELEGDANDHWPTGCLPAPILTLQGRIKRYYWHFATLGEAYLCGIAAERLAVRNLGLIAVVKGVGNHGCEYMTCRRAGRNFAARMSGGIAYVLDMTRDFKSKVNQEMVELVTFNDTHKIAGLRKLRVMPLDYKAVLEAGSKAAIPSDPHRHMPGFAIKGDTYYPVEDKAKTNVNNLLEVLTATLAPPEPPVVDLEDTMVDEASAKNIVERLDKTKGFMKAFHPVDRNPAQDPNRQMHGLWCPGWSFGGVCPLRNARP
ncbi:hypothetical protein VP01_696g4 [Puccinia sorghi]|uniref:Uncharacterized protein n=1 Tax=Puccinia sorghi TaxID=27349 RepID=A0A0L6UE04_9BASI|nr:hypothetical protein VP01_696g4 [Puccinia sorghi]